MPMRVWKVKLVCVNEACNSKQLHLSGIYNKVRAVLDLNEYYYLGAERLECGKCHRRYVSWNTVILRQLDLAHRLQFPVILTYK